MHKAIQEEIKSILIKFCTFVLHFFNEKNRLSENLKNTIQDEKIKFIFYDSNPFCMQRQPV